MAWRCSRGTPRVYDACPVYVSSNEPAAASVIVMTVVSRFAASTVMVPSMANRLADRRSPANRLNPTTRDSESSVQVDVTPSGFSPSPHVCVPSLRTCWWTSDVTMPCEVRRKPTAVSSCAPCVVTVCVVPFTATVDVSVRSPNRSASSPPVTWEACGSRQARKFTGVSQPIRLPVWPGGTPTTCTLTWCATPSVSSPRYGDRSYVIGWTLNARGAGSTYHRNGLDQPPVYTCGNGSAMPATRPSSSTCTSRYGPGSAGQEYPVELGAVMYQNSSHPPPEPVAYTSASSRSVLRGTVTVPVRSAPDWVGAASGSTSEAVSGAALRRSAA